MDNKGKDFPVYRKLGNFGRFYKILDERSFVELYFIDDKPIITRIQAQQYPEILRIQEMIAGELAYEPMTDPEIDLFNENL